MIVPKYTHANTTEQRELDCRIEGGADENGTRETCEHDIPGPSDASNCDVETSRAQQSGLIGMTNLLKHESGQLKLEAFPPRHDDQRAIHSSSDEHRLSAPSNKHISQNRLDSSYTIRNRDYLKFFKVGRVFTTLWTEGYSGTTNTRDSFVSSVVYGEQVHSKIRRFVVVRKLDRSCVCLPITIVASKPNSKKVQSINLGEHGIVFSNTMPKSLEGITLPPIRVQPTKGSGPFRDYSLVDYARPCTIEMNVKVKDVGILESESKAVLLANFRQTFFGSTDDELASVASAPTIPKATTSFDQTYAVSNLRSNGPRDSTLVSYVGTDYSVSSILPSYNGEHAVFYKKPEAILPAGAGEGQGIPDVKLDPKFCIIGQPGKFYKVGRVFKTLWSEPAGGTAKDMESSFYSKVGFDELVFSKIRRFVVVREKNHSCICLPLYTYGGQGLSKPDVRAQDHVAVQVCTADRSSTPHSIEDTSEKPSLGVIVEDADERIDPMTSINFGQVFTIQHNLKVAKIGRIHPVDIDRLNDYFIESVTT